MATEQRLKPVTLPASGDIHTSQYLFMAMGTTGVAAVGSAGGMSDGILQDKPTALGQAAEVQPLDGSISKVIVGAAGITAVGDDVSSDNTGKAQTATTGHAILARALASGASGAIVPVLLGYRGVK